MYLSDKGLLFAHIPKTAGTSFRRSVERYVWGWKVYSDYGANNPATSRLIRKFYEVDDFSKIRDLNRNKTLLAGHFPIKKYLPYYPIHRVISFVREPVQRVMSHYHDLQRRNGYSESIETFTTNLRFQNTQSRYFKDIPVEAIGFIGICEFYDESIEIINKLFHTKIPIKKYNTNEKKKEDFYVVPGETVKLIKESNKLDCELYNYALKIFLKRKELLSSNKPFIYGKIDSKSAEKIVGWAVNPYSADAVKLNLLVNDNIEKTVIANIPNQQLIELNMANNSHVSFVFDLENKYTDKDSIKVILDGEKQELD